VARTISCKDLPNAALGTVGEIPLHFIFPIEATYLTTVPTYIHYNGSIIRFFQTDGIDYPTLASAVRSLDNGSSMQLYRYHTPGRDRFFISLTHTIDYSDAIPTSIFKKISINPIRMQIENTLSMVYKAHSSFNPFLALCGFEEIDYLRCGFPALLFDHTRQGNAVTADPVRTNLSFLKIGESRFATTASINNIAAIPAVRNILEAYPYLERVVAVIPSGKRQEELQAQTLDTTILIDHLSSQYRTRQSEVSVDTLSIDLAEMLPSFGRIFYTDVTFFLTGDSIPALTSGFRKFDATMNDHDIALYCHTNTTRSTYISLFPGNDTCGERYSLVFEQSFGDLARRALEL